MDWVYVLLWSFPIIILDEFLKFLGTSLVGALEAFLSQSRTNIPRYLA